MNKLLLMAANLLLLAGAWAATWWLTGYDPTPAIPEEEREDVAEMLTSPVEEPVAAAPQRPRLESGQLEELWRRTLFNPERTETVATEKPTEQEKPEPLRPEFELMGVVRIGGKPVALMLVHPPAPAARRSGPRRARRPSANTAEKRPKVYREGALVGETGYMVKEIRLEEVTLARGDEEIVVGLAWDDAQSETRTQAAVAQAEAAEKRRERERALEERARRADREQRTAAAEEEERRDVPPAPPPPPSPGGAGTGTPPAPGEESDAPETPEQPGTRVSPEDAAANARRRARIIRERILLRRQAAQERDDE